MGKPIIMTATLHEFKIDEYEKLHQHIPPVIVKHLIEANYSVLRIFRAGTLLVMLVEQSEEAADFNREVDEEMERQWTERTDACFARSWQPLSEIFNLLETGMDEA